MLKRFFAPEASKNETVDSYLDLIYGPLILENSDNEENIEDYSSSISDDDNDYPSAGNRQHWQNAQQQFREQIRNQGCGRGRGQRCGRGRGHTLRNSRVEIDEDTNQIEYIPPVDTKDLLKKVRAAIYLSLDRLWNVPSELCLVATILDPRIKNFPFAKDTADRIEQKSRAEFLLKDLHDQLKQDLEFPEEIRLPNIVEEDDVFADMWSNDQQIAQMDENDEIKRYLQVPDEPKTVDPLLW